MLANKAHKLGAIARTKDIFVNEHVTFEGLLLSEQTLAGLTACDFEKPSPIQFKAIPFGKCGFDLIAQAKSGTGKTCMFGVIALEMLQLPSKSLQVLILAPTREIAVQVADVLTAIGQCHDGLRVVTLIGGLPEAEDRKRIKNCHVVVGTPGRVRKLVDEGSLDVSRVRMVVLDEADRLLDDSFINDIRHLLSKLPQKRQTLASSATYTPELKEFIETFMRNPLRVNPDLTCQSEGGCVLLGVRQCAGLIQPHPNPLAKYQRKVQALVHVLSNVPFKQCLVFNNMHGQAQSTSQMLTGRGWPTTFISGHMEQTKRLEAISALVDFRCRILLSTDLSARGLDAANVDLVVNMDIPKSEATYLHRVGRAGRFGTRGIVISIVENCGMELERLQNLAQITQIQLGAFHIDTKVPLPSDLLNCQLESLDEMCPRLECEVKNSESEVKNSESEVKNSESEVKNSESQVKNSESQVKNSESEVKKGECAAAAEKAQIDKARKEYDEMMRFVRESVERKLAENKKNKIDYNLRNFLLAQRELEYEEYKSEFSKAVGEFLRESRDNVEKSSEAGIKKRPPANAKEYGEMMTAIGKSVKMKLAEQNQQKKDDAWNQFFQAERELEYEESKLEFCRAMDEYRAMKESQANKSNPILKTPPKEQPQFEKFDEISKESTDSKTGTKKKSSPILKTPQKKQPQFNSEELAEISKAIETSLNMSSTEDTTVSHVKKSTPVLKTPQKDQPQYEKLDEISKESLTTGNNGTKKKSSPVMKSPRTPQFNSQELEEISRAIEESLKTENKTESNNGTKRKTSVLKTPPKELPQFEKFDEISKESTENKTESNNGTKKKSLPVLKTPQTPQFNSEELAEISRAIEESLKLNSTADNDISEINIDTMISHLKKSNNPAENKVTTPKPQKPPRNKKLNLTDIEELDFEKHVQSDCSFYSNVSNASMDLSQIDLSPIPSEQSHILISPEKDNQIGNNLQQKSNIEQFFEDLRNVGKENQESGENEPKPEKSVSFRDLLHNQSFKMTGKNLSLMHPSCFNSFNASQSSGSDPSSDFQNVSTSTPEKNHHFGKSSHPVNFKNYFQNKNQTHQYKNHTLSGHLKEMLEQIKSYSLPSLLNKEVLGYDRLKQTCDTYVPVPNRELDFDPNPKVPFIRVNKFVLGALYSINSNLVVGTRNQFYKHGGTKKYLNYLAFEDKGEVMDPRDNVVKFDQRSKYPDSFYKITRNEWTMGTSQESDENKDVQVKLPTQELISFSSEDDIGPWKAHNSRELPHRHQEPLRNTPGIEFEPQKYHEKQKSLHRPQELQQHTSGVEFEPQISPKTREFLYRHQEPLRNTSENEFEPQKYHELQEQKTSGVEIEPDKSHKQLSNDFFNTMMQCGTSEASFEYPPIPTDLSEEAFDEWKHQVKTTTFMIHYQKYMEFMSAKK